MYETVTLPINLKIKYKVIEDKDGVSIDIRYDEKDIDASISDAFTKALKLAVDTSETPKEEK